MKNHTRINKLLTALLVLCVLFVCMAGTAMAEDCAHVFADGKCTACGIIGGYCGYTINEGGVESVVWTLDEDGAFTVTGTSRMVDYSIGDRPWEAYIGNITTVSVGGGVTGPSRYAFANCTALTTVTLSEGVKLIYPHAFDSCSSLTTVTLNAGLEDIGSYAFANCTALTDVTIPEGTANIMNCAFANCTALTTVSLPSSVWQRVQDDAFDGCTNLKTAKVSCDWKENPGFTFAEGVTVKYVIHEYLSNNTCCGYCGAEGDGTNVRWSLDDDGTFTLTGTGAMMDYTSYKDRPWNDKAESITSLTIEEGVTRIGNFAFYGSTYLEDFVIPTSVKELGRGAFTNCGSLKTITIPASVTSIETNAFQGIRQLRYVNVPCSWNENPLYTFGSTVTVNVAEHTSDENSYTDNGDGTHSFTCTVCGDVTEDHTLTDGACTACDYVCPHSSFDSATGNCTDCETSVAIAKVETGGTTTYYLTADALSEAVEKNSADQAVTLLADIEILALRFFTEKTTNTLNLNGHTLTGNEPNAVLIVANGCELTITGSGSINFTDPLMSANYEGSRIVVGKDVTLNGILRSAYGGVFELTGETIPEEGLTVRLWSDGDTYNVSDVLKLPADYYLFVNGVAVHSYSENIEGTVLKHTDHSYTYTDNGDGTHDATCSVCGKMVDNEAHTPDATGYTVNADGTHSYTCSSCGNPVTEAHTFTDGACTGCGVIGGYCGEEGNEQNVIWTFAGGTLTVSGTGAMADQIDNRNNRPWEAYVDQITTIVVNDGITSIGEAAFWNLQQLTTAKLPDSLTTISRQAFGRCKALKTVNLPANLKTIEGWAFQGCYALESVTLPEGLTTVDMYAFSECINLKSVSVPASVTTIDERAFGLCPATITVDEDNPNYSSDEHGVLFDKGKTTLMYCRPNIEVETYTIPSTVTEICESAFYECKNLVTIIIPEGVTTIGQSAFSECTALTTITIPAGVTTIEFNTFSGCTSLATVTIPASVTTIGQWAFDRCTALTTVNVPCTWDGSLYTFDESVTVNKAHNWVDGACTLCGVSCDHKDSTHTTATDNGDGTHSFECSVCVNTVIEAHSTTADGDKAANCGSKAYCSECDSEYGEIDSNNHASENHTYTDNGDGTHSKVHECGVTVGEPENHTLTYTVNGSTITESCSANCGYSASLTLKAPANLVYDRTEKAATVEGEIIADYKITYSADAVIMAGDYTATLTVGDYSVSLDFTIAKADPDVATPTGLTATYGQTLADVELPGGWAWKNSSASVGSVGSNTFAAIYTPANISNFNTLERDLTVVVAKAMPTVTAPVAADDLVYNGTARTLITAGTATGGTMQYSLDGSTWSETIPTGKNADTYTVYYKVVGDGNHEDNAGGTVSVTIDPKVITNPVIEGIDAQYLHTGSAITPVPTAVKDGNTVIDPSEYTLAYENNINEGTATLKIVDAANGNYTVSGSKTFQIVVHAHVWNYSASGNTITATCNGNIGTCPDAEQSFTLNAPDVGYSGNPVEAEVTRDGTDLTFTLHYTGTNYDSADAPTNAGDYTVTMTVGDKSVSDTFTISPKDISKVASCQFSLTQISFVYSGKAPVLNVTGVDSSVGSYTMQEGTDYTVGTVQVNAGSHKLTVTGIGNYTGSVELDYTITAKEVSIIGAAIQPVTYDPNGYTLTVTGVTFDGVVDGETLAYTAEAILGNTNAFGEQDATVTVTLNNSNYNLVTATYRTKVTINKAAATVTAAPTPNDLTYTGVAQNLINGGEATGGEMQYSTDNQTWSTTIPQGTAAGEYTVYYKVVGDVNHSDTAVDSIEVTIAKTQAVITVDTTTITVTYGETVTLPTATTNFGTVVCDKTADDLVNAGTYTVTYTVAGTENFEGATKTLTVKVEQLAVEEPTVTGTYTYSGSELTAQLTGVESYMTVASGNKGVDAGNYEVEVSLDANHKWAEGYDGMIPWSIDKANAEIRVNTDPITVTYGETVTLPNATTNFGDVVCDKNASDIVNAGSYTVTYTVAGTDNYDGDTKSITVIVNAKPITVTADAISKTYGEADPKLTYTAQGLVNGDELTGELKRVSGENVGSYAIEQNTLTAGNNYTITYTGAELSIGKRNVTITAKDQTITYGGKISNTEITSDGLIDGHSVTVTLTPSTAKVTVNGTITASAAVITADGTDVTANYDITYAGGKLEIEPDTSKIDGLTPENVTSANEEDIKAVKEMMEDAESVKDEWNAIADTCEDLIERIEAVEAAKNEVTEEASDFHSDTVKSSDKENLNQLAEAIEALLATENLTEDERKALEEVLKQVEGMIDTIEDTANDSKAAADVIDALDPATVTSDDKDELEQAIETIDELLAEDHLTEAEREVLMDVKAEAEALIERIEAVQDATTTENTEKVEDVTAENVKPEDKEALEDAKADLEKALEDNAGNYTEEEKKTIRDEIDRIEAAMDALENVEDVTESIGQLPETVVPDDEEAVEQIQAAKDAYDALTEHEKSLVEEEAVERLNDLVAAMTDYEIIKGSGNQWTEDSDHNIEFTANGAFSKFTGVEVDGKTVDAKYYTAKSGSTIVTLKAEFLQTLSAGQHTFKVLYTDGECHCLFRIKEVPVVQQPTTDSTNTGAPMTGDTSHIGLWMTLAGISAMGLMSLGWFDRKRRSAK